MHPQRGFGEAMQDWARPLEIGKTGTGDITGTHDEIGEARQDWARLSDIGTTATGDITGIHDVDLARLCKIGQDF